MKKIMLLLLVSAILTGIASAQGYEIKVKIHHIPNELPVGMYFLFLPSHNYFDILVDGNQKFTIENDTTEFLKNMIITGSIENQVFHDYQEMLNSSTKEYRELSEQLEAVKGDEAKENEIKEKMKAISIPTIFSQNS